MDDEGSSLIARCDHVRSAALENTWAALFESSSGRDYRYQIAIHRSDSNVYLINMYFLHMRGLPNKAGVIVQLRLHLPNWDCN